MKPDDLLTQLPKHFAFGELLGQGQFLASASLVLSGGMVLPARWPFWGFHFIPPSQTLGELFHLMVIYIQAW